MKNPISKLIGWLCLFAGLGSFSASSASDISEFERNFEQPPASARPWVYWFWLNSNITRHGITADLEAMKRAGIGGVLIMEVDQGAPVGPVPFMSDRWRQLFQFMIGEAQRLGLEVNMNNDAGWNGSGGPWIRPEQSMQKVVWSETGLEGPGQFTGRLPQPAAVAGFYRDIAVLAFPATGGFRIPDINIRAAYQVGRPGPIPRTNLSPVMVIKPGTIRDLTSQMDSSGHLRWAVPAGQWTVLRLGHTSTGMENAPSPASGRGLECDKLSPSGIEANFAGLMRKLITDNPRAAGKTLVATHIDSWENGSQNWTEGMRQEFQKRHGYDPLEFLPVFTGRVVGNLDISERFLWDLRRTISDLVVENYAGHLRALAHQHGLRLSIEAYGGPCDDLPYAGRADEPMCEFWMGGGAFETCKLMASAAHTYGKCILGAESFTAGNQERWLEHPATIKSLGDRAFCAGVNRFVFHRYALQPWAEQRLPGMTMGPWGLHYERTQTWWDWSKPWHEYLARCQWMLRQGLFVADICYLEPEEAPQAAPNHPRRGYDYDDGSPEVVLKRMSVSNGRLVLPDGMSYRVLVLPETRAMTPPLLRQIHQLVRAGATVIGPKPTQSPSLTDFPKCDAQVQRLAAELWAGWDGHSVKEHAFGKGRIIGGLEPESVLENAGVRPDFSSRPPLNYIHRSSGQAEIYFVANPQSWPTVALAEFRVTGRAPELWWPETGRIEPAPLWQEKNGRTTVTLSLRPTESVFVVFRHNSAGRDSILTVKRDGKKIFPPAEPAPKISIVKAVYGVLTDPKRTRDVREKIQQWVDHGETSFEVARLARGDDPAYLVVKTALIEYRVGGRRFTAKATDPETITLAQPANSDLATDICADGQGRWILETTEPGHYEVQTAAGRTLAAQIDPAPQPLELRGPWQIAFPGSWKSSPGQPAPAEKVVEQANLISWSESNDPSVKYFSGKAAYRKKFNLPVEFIAPHRRVFIDLGDVQIMARLKLNGHDFGVLWKPPFRTDITQSITAGENTLEIQVVNLWVNRMIGDEQLPEDSDRNPNGTLKKWPDWLERGQPSPTGRFTFTTWRLWKKGSPLQPSGLLGPVRIYAIEQVAMPQP